MPLMAIPCFPNPQLMHTHVNTRTRAYTHTHTRTLQHYNSVRNADDFNPGPPAPITYTGNGLVPAPTVGYNLF